MSVFEDILDTDTTLGKIAFGLVSLVLAWVLVTAVVGVLIFYRVIHPDIRGAGLRPEDLAMSKPEVVPFSPRGEKSRDGWFFPGQVTSPTIILCHGYGTHRVDLITMVSALQKDRFNVFVFDFSGHGQTAGITSLGPKETKELIAAVDAILERTDVDRTRVGVWGFDLGGYAALSAALIDQRIKAVAVDSVYERPAMMFDLLAQQSALAKVPYAPTVARWIYTLQNWGARKVPPLSEQVSALTGTAKFYIQGRDNPVLAETTLRLFMKSPEPRRQTVMPKSNYAGMLEEERKTYEGEVVHFFLEAFPPAITR
ncbi:MAG: alpha/beta fold hydrolase [Acidobacteria bacterium]|nr:alpha/beta fold hydrolase [Acidobacteriota bacterium]